MRSDTRIGLMGVGVLAAGLLFGAAALAACGSGGGGASPAAPKTIAITPVAQSGTTTDAVVGDTIVVYLDANPTTGFSWEFTAGDTFEIVSSEYTPDPASQGATGAGGTQIVTLKVTKAGTSDLTGSYRQQWSSPSPDAQPDFSMTIVSTD